MSAVRVLFVTHASRVTGAELVLLDVVQAFRGARAFLFEDGPLRSALAALDITSILPGAPGGLARMLVRLIRAARGADLVYANSPKAFALAAPACGTAPRYEVVPAARPGYLWTPGYWDYRRGRHYWVGGTYVRERRGYVYAQPAWEQRGGAWHFNRGGWNRGDRDHDGVPNRFDNHPDNPYRR